MADQQEYLYRLEKDLAPYLPRENEMGVLLSAAAKGASVLDSEITAVETGLTIQEATTKAELEQIAYPVQVPTNESENLETYRSKVLQNFQLLTRDASPEEMLNLVATILETDVSNLKIENIEGEPRFRVTAPLPLVKESFGDKSFAEEVLLSATGASYGIELFGTGTLEYITPEEYDAGSYDTNTGYATVDSETNITSGGTYSGKFIG